MPVKKYTDSQILSALDQAGTRAGAAALLGLDLRTLYRRLARIAESDSETMPSPAEPVSGEIIKGRSTLYDPQTGEAKLEWIKTSRDADAVKAALTGAFEGFKDQIPRAGFKASPKAVSDALLSCFVITDYHLGSLAWGEETRGADWDISIAEEMLVNWFEAAIAAAPPAKKVVLAQLGDCAHYDSLDAVTPSHGHVLDSDTRLQLLARTVIRVMRRVIEMLSQRYEQIHVIYAEGNHDLATSAYMREWLAAHYEDEPRVTIDTSPDPYYCVEHGNTSLFFHHGHLKKMGEIEQAFIAKFRDTFGRTKNSYGHVGHLHHKVAQESSLMIVEQHETLAAQDAYASRHGYQAQRSAQVITYHQDHGEVGRVRLTPEMVTAQAA